VLHLAQALWCVAVVTLLRSTCFVQAGALVHFFRDTKQVKLREKIYKVNILKLHNTDSYFIWLVVWNIFDFSIYLE